MPAVSVLMKPSSGMCNMSCDYCFYRDEAVKREQESFGFMTDTTLKNIIRKTLVKAQGFASYAFQGGEPTLIGLDFYKKVIQYEKQYNKNNVIINNAIQTNGLLINEEWCQFLKENDFLVGVSIDGNKQIHDLYRHDNAGNDTYQKIKNNIDLLDKYGVEYNILTVVTQQAAQNIKDIYQHYKDNGWNYQQYIACLDPLGETRGLMQYALTPEVYGKFLVELFDMWYEDWKLGKQPYIRQFENYVGIVMGRYPEACNQRGICSIQNICEADGSVYPCDFYVLDEYKIGNFNENRLDEIVENSKGIGFVERSLKLDSDCKECKHFSVCRGGCQRERQYNNDSDSYKNYFCESFKYFFDNCYDKMKEIADSVSGI